MPDRLIGFGFSISLPKTAFAWSQVMARRAFVICCDESVDSKKSFSKLSNSFVGKHRAQKRFRLKVELLCRVHCIGLLLTSSCADGFAATQTASFWLSRLTFSALRWKHQSHLEVSWNANKLIIIKVQPVPHVKSN
jgi:hypothetical protein